MINELEKEARDILTRADEVINDLKSIEILTKLREQYVRNEISADEYIARVGVALKISS